MDVLCTDKTGTLTEARIRLEQHLDPAGNDSARVLRLAFLNSANESGLKSPLDDAILAHGEVDVPGWRKLDEVPFDFERRRVSVLVEDATQRLLIVKGAPEDVLRVCTQVEDGTDADGSPRTDALDDRRRQACTSLLDRLADQGFRVLVAWRAEPGDFIDATAADETTLVLAGFVAFLDPPKQSVPSQRWQRWRPAAWRSRSSPATTSWWRATSAANWAWRSPACSPARRSRR